MEVDKENRDGVDKNGSSVGYPATTPSKQRYSLGAASSYYFKYMNSTAKKAQKAGNTSILDDVDVDADDDGDDLTGTISIPGAEPIAFGGGDTSFFSIAASSSSGESSDLLNKSTLSDTTELTASNFVLAAASRQKIRRLANFGKKLSDAKIDAGATAKKTQKNLDAIDNNTAEPSDDMNDSTGKVPLPERLATGPKDTDVTKSDDVTASSNKNGQLEVAGTDDSIKSPNQQRQSFRGSSPSLRSRISASPSSLRKLTASLKNSRIKRQQQRGSDDKFRSLGDTTTNSLKDVALGLDNGETVERNRLPPKFLNPSRQSYSTAARPMTSPSERSSPSGTSSKTGGTTQEILGAMDEIFMDLDADDGDDDGDGDDTLPVASRQKRSSITARKSSIDRIIGNDNAMSDLMEKSENTLQGRDEDADATPPSLSNSPENEQAGHVPSSIEFSTQDEATDTDTVASKTPTRKGGGGSDQDLSTSPANVRTNFQLTPSSAQRPTPTKLTPNPVRVLKHKFWDSPARNTRSAKKRTAAWVGDSKNKGRPSSEAKRRKSVAKTTSNDLYATSPEQASTTSTDRSMDSPSTKPFSYSLEFLTQPSPSQSEASPSLAIRKSTGSLELESSAAKDSKVSSEKVGNVPRTSRQDDETNSHSDISVRKEVQPQGRSNDKRRRSSALSTSSQAVSEMPSDATASIGDLDDLLDVSKTPRPSNDGKPIGDTPTPSSSSAGGRNDSASHGSELQFDVTKHSEASKKSPNDAIANDVSADSHSVNPPRRNGPEMLAAVTAETPNQDETNSQIGTERDLSIHSHQFGKDGTPASVESKALKGNSGDETASISDVADLLNFGGSTPLEPKEKKVEQQEPSSSKASPPDPQSSLMSKESPSSERYLREKSDEETASMGDIARLLDSSSPRPNQQRESLPDEPEAQSKSSLAGKSFETNDSSSPPADAKTDEYERTGPTPSKNFPQSPTTHTTALSATQKQPENDSTDEATARDDTSLLLSTSNRSEAGSFASGKDIPSEPEPTNVTSPPDRSVATAQSQSTGTEGKNDVGIERSFKKQKVLKSGTPSTTPTRSKRKSLGESFDSFDTAMLHSPIRLVPNSHVKPTPTKIEPSPRRIPNPRLVDSPARRTRSATKISSANENENENSRSSLADFHLANSRKKPPNLFEQPPRSPDRHEMLGLEFGDDPAGQSSVKRKSLSARGQVRDDKENQLPKSPPPKKMQPVGILSSKKSRIASAHKTSHRVVAFGSPEAAEYRINSPSVSLTPMPSSKARALFSIPRGPKNGNERNFSSDGADHPFTGVEKSVEIEANLDLLVDRIAAETLNQSRALSPIENVAEKGETNEFRFTESGGVTKVAAHQSDSNSVALSATSSVQGEETVELEGGMGGLLANAMKASAKLGFQASTVSSPVTADSGLSTNDTTSTIDTQTRPPEEDPKGTASQPDSSSVDFSTASFIQGEETVGLEGGMDGLLANAIKASAKLGFQASTVSNPANADSGLSTDDTTSIFDAQPDVEETKSPQKSTMIAASQSDSVSVGFSTASFLQGGETVELEGGMEGLLINAMKSSARLGLRTPRVSNAANTDSGLSTDDTTSTRNAQSDVEETNTPEKSSRTHPGESFVPLGQRPFSPPESVDMADAKSIATMNSKVERYTSEFVLNAQKLDFSIHTVLESGIDKSVTSFEEGQTVELEGDMASLLAAAGAPEICNNSKVDQTSMSTVTERDNDDKDGESLPLGDPATELNSDKKSSGIEESEISTRESTTEDFGSSDEELSYQDNENTDTEPTKVSHHFTMGPAKLNISPSGDVLDNDKSSILLSPSDREAEPISEPRPSLTPHEKLDVDAAALFSDISAAAGILTDGSGTSAAVDTIDTVTALNERIERTTCAPIAQRWNQFLNAVCVEVERRIEPSELAATRFSDIVASDPSTYQHLHQQLKSDYNDNMKQAVERLGIDCKRFIAYEWDNWLATVMESFENPLLEISNSISETMRDVDASADRCSDYLAMISLANSRKMHNARRKSLTRLQSAALSLEAEVKELQAQVIKSNEQLEVAKADDQTNCDVLRELKSRRSLRDECKTIREEALSIQNSYLSLKGIQSCAPTSISPVGIKFQSLGCTNKTNGSLSCEIDGTTGTARVTSFDVSLGGTKAAAVRKYNSGISAFLASRVESLLRSIDTMKLGPATESGNQIQNFMWQLGRHEATAEEIYRLQRRFGARLTGENGKYFLSMHFESKSAKLGVTFELAELYPTVPLEVRMDVLRGSADLAYLRRALTRNAKPGYGHLSKACNIISAFVV